MKAALIALVLVLVVVVALSGVFMGGYNQLDMERHDIQARWSQLDKDMKQRANLVSNLIQPLKVRNNQEQTELGEAEQACSTLLAAQSERDEVMANSRLSLALVALQHRYSQFTSAQSLQDADQKIAQDGTDYNEAIEKYDRDLQLFPKNVVASIFHFRRDDSYFRTPQVK